MGFGCYFLTAGMKIGFTTNGGIELNELYRISECEHGARTADNANNARRSN
jgi:hypothetical protein